MKTILKHKSTRRNFLIIVGLILIIIFITRLFVLPKSDPSDINQTFEYFRLVLDNLFIALLVTTFLGWFTFYIEIPESEKKHSILEPNHINEYFPKARLETDFWYFSGGTGRYTRAVTIPEFAKKAKDSNSHQTLKILILDPQDSVLCDSYAKFRASLRSAKDSENKWTATYVRNEVMATICSAIIYKNLSPLLEISIYLKNSFSTLRYDLSNKYCIVTKEDKKEPAILIPNDTFLFRTYKEEILHTAKQLEEINSGITINDLKENKITSKNIEKIVSDLEWTEIFDENSHKKIAEILNKNHNPYG